MGIIFTIHYHELVAKEDILRLSGELRKRIKTAIETRLSSFPDLYGKPLRRSLRGYRKLRVGDYRVIFRIEGQSVKIFFIGHRSAVYENAEGRLKGK
jgi:mRNA interferase RelE/StbE